MTEPLPTVEELRSASREFYVDGLWKTAALASRLAQESSNSVPYFVIAGVLRTVAREWGDRPLGVSVAKATEAAILPRLDDVLDQLVSQPGTCPTAALERLIAALYSSDYRNRSYT